MLFEFHDPCETCSVPLDSPRCESCPYNEDNLTLPSEPVYRE